MADHVLTFFTMMDNQGGVIVKDVPKLDLDLYIQNYTGRTRYDRLFHIGRTSVPLAVDALKAAVVEAKRGKDVTRYKDAWDHLRTAAPGEPEAALDRAWIDNTEAKNRAETHRLEAELKGYKNNLIKESIRMGNEDLGKHLENIGDLNGAYEAFARMRQDISTSKHLFDVGKHLVGVALQRREWNMVLTNLNKMGTLTGEEEKLVQPYQKIATGIAYLGLERFAEAAATFLQADSSVLPSHYSEIASQNDVATYGGLLALASMDRRDLQTKVLDNPSFRGFLELEPHIRRAVNQFVNGRYSACLETLEAYRADYLLDIHLQKHVQKIYADIRSKCIVQYLLPFSRVTLESMNQAFATQGKSIEDELVAMIRAGTLEARIDTINKLVTTVTTNPRYKMQAAALATAQGYEKDAIERIRRMNLILADLEVKGTKKSLELEEQAALM